MSAWLIMRFLPNFNSLKLRWLFCVNNLSSCLVNGKREMHLWRTPSPDPKQESKLGDASLPREVQFSPSFLRAV